MPGLSLTATAIEDRSGILVVGLWEALEAVRRHKQWLDDTIHNDAALGSGGIGVAAGSLTVIRSTFTDLAGASGLYGVAHGTVTPSGANNYFFNAKNLTGLNYAA